MQNFCHKGSSEQLIIVVVDCFCTGKPVCCKFFIAFLLKHQQKTAEYFLLITKMTVDLTVIKAACALSKPLPQQVIFYTAFLNRKEHAKVVIQTITCEQAYVACMFFSYIKCNPCQKSIVIKQTIKCFCCIKYICHHIWSLVYTPE